jgi:phosphatidylglycerol lysyltransferase
MTPRHVRRVVAVGAFASGVADMVLAAGRHTHVRATVVAFRWAIQAVVGARFLVLLAGLVLVLMTRGLLHGKRNAWLLALVVTVASLAGHHVKEADALGLAVTIGFGALLVGTRRHFKARSDPALARRGVQLLVIGELTTFMYGTIGLYLLDRQFRAATTLVQSAREAARLLVLLPANTVEPLTRHGSWFIDSVRIAALGVGLASAFRLVATVVWQQPRTDQQTVKALLEAWADSPLAYFHLLSDKAWLVARDRQAFIGYKMVGTTALALGEPVGEPGSCLIVVTEFLELCDLNGWTPAFHQVGDNPQALEGAGLKLLKIGEEAIIDVRVWNLDAKENKQLRSALRRVERAGLEVVELRQPIDDDTMAELRDVSDAWMADGSHRERTFTLGQFDPAYLRATRVLVVREHGEGRIVAFANVLPSYRSGIGNFDLMRRHPDAPNGVMEYLFVTLIHRFRDEGMRGMTLGLAPLANITGDGLADRALRLLYEQGNRAFNYQGLHQFKSKWKPIWEPRFLAYRSDTELPKVAAAIMRAGELPDLTKRRARAARLARRLPFTVAVESVTLWLMAATAIDRDGHPALFRLFGLGWHDLVHLQVWRLATALMMQTRPGFRWANVALCFLALPVAEWRLGTRRTIAYFCGCDWIASTFVFIGARIASSSGNATAIEIITTRDAGPSAGAWALVIATTLSFTNPRIRRWTTGAAFAFLTGAAVFHHRLFDLQHLLAALVALAAAPIARRGEIEGCSTG